MKIRCHVHARFSGFLSFLLNEKGWASLEINSYNPKIDVRGRQETRLLKVAICLPALAFEEV